MITDPVETPPSKDHPLQPRFVSIVKGRCVCSRSAAGFLVMIETQGLDWRAGSEHRQTPNWRSGRLARLYRARKLTQLGPVFHRLDCRAHPHPLALSLQPIANDDVVRTDSTTRQAVSRRRRFGAQQKQWCAAVLPLCSPSFCRELQKRKPSGARLGTTAGNRSARYVRPCGSLRRFDR